MIRGSATFAVIVCCALLAPPAEAHPKLSEYVQHDITLEAGSSYIDLTIRLTFFDRHATLQELFLDSDGDGGFSGAERKAFRRELLEAAEEQFSLHAGAAQLELVPLYDPVIKAAAPDESGNIHRRFEVHLTFFARLPRGARNGVALEVRDGLYPNLPALAGFHVAGKDGIRITTDNAGHDLTRPADPKQPLVLGARLDRADSQTVEPTPPIAGEEGEKP